MHEPSSHSDNLSAEQVISSCCGSISSPFAQKQVSTAYPTILVHFFKSIFVKALIQSSHLHLDLPSTLFSLSFAITSKMFVQCFVLCTKFCGIQQTKCKQCLCFIVSLYCHSSLTRDRETKPSVLQVLPAFPYYFQFCRLSLAAQAHSPFPNMTSGPPLALSWHLQIPLFI